MAYFIIFVLVYESDFNSEIGIRRLEDVFAIQVKQISVKNRQLIFVKIDQKSYSFQLRLSIFGKKSFFIILHLPPPCTAAVPQV